MSRNYGIDYGMGKSNIDHETGIRFGVIPMHSLSEWAFESFEADYGDPTCGKCGNALVEYDDDKHGEYPDVRHCCDFACETCEIIVGSDDAYADEPHGHNLDDGQYKAVLGSDGDVFVLKSPYFTHAQFCSPCAPGACHLGHPVDKDGPKCYCFGHDWFEGDKAPYPVYAVTDGEEVVVAS